NLLVVLLMMLHLTQELEPPANPARFRSHQFKTQIELFRRMVSNLLIGNTDDHARNHAAVWDGEGLTLTPAYDIELRPRLGRKANQAIRVHGTSRESRVALAIEAAPMFGLSAAAAVEIIAHQVETIHAAFAEAAEEARLTETDRSALANRAVLNSYAFEGSPAKIVCLDPAYAISVDDDAFPDSRRRLLYSLHSHISHYCSRLE
ncbi:HipA domain-containing protein, partial [Primorskyibacter sp. 2E107]|uniref:HipA domain-containing protein n=1 Tax=Primorskyibacter sp. 2E107 TaxID=3403458 RepID=UPI003AF60888